MTYYHYNLKESRYQTLTNPEVRGTKLFHRNFKGYRALFPYLKTTSYLSNNGNKIFEVSSVVSKDDVYMDVISRRIVADKITREIIKEVLAGFKDYALLHRDNMDIEALERMGA